MFNSLNKLRESVLGRKTNPEERLRDKIASMMMDMNISYKDMMDMHICAFMELSNALDSIKERERKRYKGKK